MGRLSREASTTGAVVRLEGREVTVEGELSLGVDSLIVGLLSRVGLIGWRGCGLVVTVLVVREPDP